MELWKPCEIFIKILQLPNRPLEKDPSIPEKIMSMIEDLKFPQYSNAEIRQMEKEFITADSFCDVLDAHKFRFSFYPNLITMLLKIEKKELTMPEKFSNVVFYSFITWYRFYYKSHNSEYLIVLLNALTYVYLSEIPNCVYQAKEIAISAAFRCIKLLLKYPASVNYSLYFDNIYKFYFENEGLPDFSFKILSNLALQVIDERSSKIEGNAAEYISVMNNIVPKFDKKFPTSVINLILRKIASPIFSLDMIALSYFATVSKYTSFNDRAAFFPAVSTSILETINETTAKVKVTKVDITDSTVILNEMPNIDQRFEPFQGSHSFSTITSVFNFSDAKKFESLFNADSLKSIDHVIIAITPDLNSAQAFLDYYSEKMFELGKEHDPLHCAVLFYLCLKISEHQAIQINPAHLYNSFTFSPAVDVFHPSQAFSEIDPLRYAAIELLTKASPISIANILQDASHYPYVFAEIVRRLSTIVFHTKPEIISKIGCAVIKPFFEYRKYETDWAEEAMRAILDYLTAMFSDITISSAYFSSVEFVRLFYMLLLDSTASKFVLALFTLYLSNGPSVTKEFVEITGELIDSTFAIKDNYAQWMKVTQDVIHSINDVVSINSNFAVTFTGMTEQICRSLTKLRKEEGAVDVLMEVVSFLANTSHGHSIQFKELISVEAAINRLTGNNPGTLIFTRLVHILAGRTLSCILPNFEIVQPKVLCLFVRVFIGSDDLLKALNFVNSLCAAVPENCRHCHNGDFDVFMIELVEKWRSDGNVQTEIVRTALQLIGTISSTYSSPIIVQRFIALLSPVDGVHLPFYHSEIVQSLNCILMSSMNFPSAFLPFDRNSKVSIDGMTNEDFGNAFAFNFWIYESYNEKLFKQIIFVASDNSGHAVKLSLTGDNLVARIYNNDDSYSGNFQIALKKRVWSMVTMALTQTNNDDAGSVITVYVNGSVVRKITKFNCLRFKPGPVSAIVNMSSNKYKDAECKNRMASFSFLSGDISQEDITAALDRGPRQPFMHQNRVFGFEPQQSNSRLILRSISKDVIQWKCQRKHIKTDPNFATVLVDVSKVENVIPIFAQLDLETVKGDKPILLEEMATDVIKNVISLGESAQLSFCDVGGFKAIAHLLLAASPEHLTYQLYTRLFGITQVITSTDLLKQLYDSIIFNLDIWIRAPFKYHMRIIRHWAHNALQMVNQPEEIRQFKWFVNALRVYYWYEKTESGIITERCNNEEMNVNDCRRYITEIMEFYVSKSFTKENFNSLIESMEDNNDLEQVSNILKFIMKLLNNTETFEKVSSVIVEDTAKFIPVIKKKPNNIVLLVLQIVILIYIQIPSRRKELSTFIASCLSEKCHINVDDDLLLQLIEIMNNDVPELIPLVSWVGYKLKKIPEMVKEIKENQSYYFGDISFLWIILSCFTIPEEDIPDVMMFCATVFCNQWTEIYQLICVLGRGLNKIETSEKINAQFLKICTNKLISMKEKPSTEQVTILHKIATHFIFMRPYPSDVVRTHFNARAKESRPLITNDFLTAWKESPFYQPEKNTELQRVPIPRTLVQLLDILKIDNVPFFFRLRMTDRGRWEDHPLATELIYICSKVNEPSLVVDSLLICGVLSYEDPFVVKDYIQTYKKAIVVSKPTEAMSFIKSKNTKYAQIPIKLPDDYMYRAFRFYEDSSERIDKMSDKMTSYANNLASSLASLEKTKHSKEQNKSEVLAKFNEDRRNNSQNNERTWINMWRSLTLDRAPWNNALPPISRKTIRYKRDNVICRAFCPSKLRRNFNFDDHMEASITRDKGDNMVARSEVEKKRMEIKEKRQRLSTLDLPDNDVRRSSETGVVEINDRSLFVFPCEVVTVSSRTPARFSVYSNKIVIDKGRIIIIPKERISHIFYRLFKQKETGIEIYTEGGKSHLIDFMVPSAPIANRIYRTFGLVSTRFRFMQNSPPPAFLKQTKVTELWVNREISTFEYLMFLNIVSGRSFNSPSIYPVFPWVLKDYSSPQIDLASSRVYRDLSLPVGAFNKERFEDLLVKYEELKMLEMDPYLYNSGFVYPLCVYLWLVRLEPFTTLHIDMQGGRFDHAARLFSSMADAFRLVNEQSGDFRELIPEFFYMSDFLINMNKFDLGENVGTKIDDVVLPEWANGSADEFIYLNRRALESEYVSSHINEWIDLIWGINQNNISAKNVFKPEMYSNIWDNPENERDPGKKIDIELTLEQIGQIPPPLFSEPHPKRVQHAHTKPLLKNTILSTPIGEVVRASISGIDSSGFFFTIFSDHILTRFRINYNFNSNTTQTQSQNQSQSQEEKTSINQLERREFDRSVYSKLICMEDNALVFLDDTNTNIRIVRPFTSVEEEIIESHPEVVAVGIRGRYTTVAGNDATLTVFGGREPMTMRSYRDCVQCIAMSTAFDQVVAGTRDGALLFGSLSRGSITSIVELKKRRPQSILITPAMGFVLVDLTRPKEGTISHRLTLYTINGRKLRSLEAPFEVAAWASWSTVSGFDFVAVADSSGGLWVGEAFFIEGMAHVYDCGSPVASLYYLRNELAIVAICNNGKVHIIPFGTSM